MFLLIGIKGTPAGGKCIWDRDHKLGSSLHQLKTKKIGKVEIVRCAWDQGLGWILLSGALRVSITPSIVNLLWEHLGSIL